MDPAAPDLLQVVDGWGPVLGPLIPVLLGRCFWPLPWFGRRWSAALSPPSYFPHHSSKIGEWNEGAVSGVSKRNITCCGSIFFFFSSNIFPCHWGYTGEWDCPACFGRSSQQAGKATSRQNLCDWFSCFKARYCSISLGLSIFFFFFNYSSIISLLGSIQAEAKTLCISLRSIN